MQSKEPVVSIVVPSFNQGRYIAETIRSCLAQDYRPLEIIVQDGGSSDETLEVLKQFENVVVRSVPDKGVVDGVNKGLQAARGDILTIMSSDDVFLSGAVRAAVQQFRRRPETLLVYGDVEHIDENSLVTGYDMQGGFDLASYLGRLIYIPQPGTFFSRKALEVACGWRDDFSYVADADFWIRIALAGPVNKLHRFVAQYRYHAEQRDRHSDRILRDWEAMIANLTADKRMDRRLVRYARSGVHLARMRYRRPQHWTYRTRCLYAALLVNPELIFESRLPKHELLPGREPIWTFLSRTKRALGFRPRVV